MGSCWKTTFMIMRQDLECSCWGGKKHGGQIGIKRKAMELSWRKAMEEKESREKHDYGGERERERDRLLVWV